jgi:hypothetical protein
MGDLVDYRPTNSALMLAQQDPEQALAAYEKRLKDAEDLEKKLKMIDELVPTRPTNVMGSTAGAGSGEFHMYRQVRRKEQDRVRRMEAYEAKRTQEEEFEAKRTKAQQEIEARTSKKRAKRQKTKEKKKAAKVAKAADGGAAAGGAQQQQQQGPQSDSEDSGSEGPEQAALD